MTIRSLFSFPRTFPSASLISQKDAEPALDCGDYANEAMEREISVLQLRPVQKTPHKATAGTRTIVGEAVVGTLTSKGSSWGQDFWRDGEANFS